MLMKKDREAWKKLGWEILISDLSVFFHRASFRACLYAKRLDDAHTLFTSGGCVSCHACVQEIGVGSTGGVAQKKKKKQKRRPVPIRENVSGFSQPGGLLALMLLLNHEKKQPLTNVDIMRNSSK